MMNTTRRQLGAMLAGVISLVNSRRLRDPVFVKLEKYVDGEPPEWCYDIARKWHASVYADPCYGGISAFTSCIRGMAHELWDITSGLPVRKAGCDGYPHTPISSAKGWNGQPIRAYDRVMYVTGSNPSIDVIIKETQDRCDLNCVWVQEITKHRDDEPILRFVQPPISIFGGQLQGPASNFSAVEWTRGDKKYVGIVY